MRIRAQWKDGTTDVRVLMAHPMENGLRKDAAGQPIPARYIREVTATSGGRTLLSARWGQSISQNPYLQFRFRGGQAGDTVVIAWTDTAGDTRRDEAVVVRAV